MNPTWGGGSTTENSDTPPDPAVKLRKRCSLEAKRLRDATLNLQRYLADCELVESPNLERERHRRLRDAHGRLVH